MNCFLFASSSIFIRTFQAQAVVLAAFWVQEVVVAFQVQAVAVVVAAAAAVAFQAQAVAVAFRAQAVAVAAFPVLEVEECFRALKAVAVAAFKLLELVAVAAAAFP